jgi:hypothetical protein
MTGWSVILILLAGSLSVCDAQIVANFTGSNGTTSVDGYVGKSGSGWASAWSNLTNSNISSSSAGITTGIANLNSGGNYLSATFVSTAGTNSTYTANGNFLRQYSSATVSNSLPIQYSWTFDPITAGQFTMDDSYSNHSGPAVGYTTWAIIGNTTSGAWTVHNGSTVVTTPSLDTTGDIFNFTVLSFPSTQPLRGC